MSGLGEDLRNAAYKAEVTGRRFVNVELTPAAARLLANILDDVES